MLLIVRVYIDGKPEDEWDCIMNNIKRKPTKSIRPMYMSLLKNKEYIDVIFKVNRIDPIIKYLRENVQSCEKVQGTRTVTLIKPVFLPIPKDRSEGLCRFTIALKVLIKDHHDIYNTLLNYKYGNEFFPNYVSYTLGEWDMLISLLAKDYKTVKAFADKHLNKIPGVVKYEIRTISKSEHLSTEDEWRTLQKSLLHIPRWMSTEEMQKKYLYDYDMEISDYYCALTCAMSDEF